MSLLSRQPGRRARKAGQAGVPGEHGHVGGSPSPLFISHDRSHSTCKPAAQALKSRFGSVSLHTSVCALGWVPGFRDESDPDPALKELTVWLGRHTQTRKSNIAKYIKER